MEKQRWEESEKSREEARRSEKRKGERKDDAGARKGRKVAKHCVLTMICGSGGSKKWACARIRTVTTLTTPHDTTRKDTTRHHTHPQFMATHPQEDMGLKMDNHPHFMAYWVRT